MHACFKTRCGASQCNQLLLKDSIDVSRDTDERYVHIHIIRFTLTLPSSGSLASIHNRDVLNHSLLADPFSLSVKEHMVDIMRFECVQEMKRIYHLQLLLGKYLLFPEPCEMEADHG